MSTFKNIEKLGLKIWDYKDPHHHFVVDAKDLEVLLLRAQVVYGLEEGGTFWWATHQLSQDTHQALLVGITPIKKKTKAEAALEFVKKISLADVSCSEPYVDEAKRILEMKDEV